MAKKARHTKASALVSARSFHEKWLAKRGLTVASGRRPKYANAFPDLSTPKHYELSNTVAPGAASTANKLTDHLWKAGEKESEEAVAAALRKKSRIAPAYSKGAVQYLGDDDLKAGSAKK